jgi:hypothetical protein
VVHTEQSPAQGSKKSEEAEVRNANGEDAGSARGAVPFDMTGERRLSCSQLHSTPTASATFEDRLARSRMSRSNGVTQISAGRVRACRPLLC